MNKEFVGNLIRISGRSASRSHRNLVYMYIAGLCGVFLLTIGAVGAQSVNLNFPSRSITIEEAIETIEQQSDYLISINHTDFDISEKVRLTSTAMPLEMALDEIFEKSGRDYQILGVHILVYPSSNPPFSQIPPEPIDVFTVPEGVNLANITLEGRAYDFTEEMTQYMPLAQAQQMMAASFIARSTYMKLPPATAVKINLLYGLGTLTPNIGLEIGLGAKSTIDLAGSYNPWKLNGTAKKNKKLAHWRVGAEYRYWFCERFNGHFIGGHIFAGGYNISQYKLPLLFGSNSDKYRYKGDIYGVGISYGYQLMLGTKWNIEFTVGAGYGRMNYDKFDCPRCSTRIAKETRNYFGPTRAGVTLVFLIK